MNRTGLMPGKGRDAEYGRAIWRLRNLGGAVTTRTWK
jgi:hypothetical protein